MNSDTEGISSGAEVEIYGAHTYASSGDDSATEGNDQPGELSDEGSIQPGELSDEGSIQPGEHPDEGSIQLGENSDEGSIQSGVPLSTEVEAKSPDYIVTEESGHPQQTTPVDTQINNTTKYLIHKKNIVSSFITIINKQIEESETTMSTRNTMNTGDYIQSVVDYLLNTTPEQFDTVHPNMELYRDLVSRLCKYKDAKNNSFFKLMEEFSKIIMNGSQDEEFIIPRWIQHMVIDIYKYKYPIKELIEHEKNKLSVSEIIAATEDAAYGHDYYKIKNVSLLGEAFMEHVLKKIDNWFQPLNFTKQEEISVSSYEIKCITESLKRSRYVTLTQKGNEFVCIFNPDKNYLNEKPEDLPVQDTVTSWNIGISPAKEGGQTQSLYISIDYSSGSPTIFKNIAGIKNILRDNKKIPDNTYVFDYLLQDSGIEKIRNELKNEINFYEIWDVTTLYDGAAPIGGLPYHYHNFPSHINNISFETTKKKNNSYPININMTTNFIGTETDRLSEFIYKRIINDNNQGLMDHIKNYIKVPSSTINNNIKEDKTGYFKEYGLLLGSYFNSKFKVVNIQNNYIIIRSAILTKIDEIIAPSEPTNSRRPKRDRKMSEKAIANNLQGINTASTIQNDYINQIEVHIRKYIDENNLDNSAITSIKKKIEEFNIETEGYKIVIYPIFTKLLGFINDINNDNKQENEMIVDVMIYILYASLEMETNRVYIRNTFEVQDSNKNIYVDDKIEILENLKRNRAVLQQYEMVRKQAKETRIKNIQLNIRIKPRGPGQPDSEPIHINNRSILPVHPGRRPRTGSALFNTEQVQSVQQPQSGQQMLQLPSISSNTTIDSTPTKGGSKTHKKRSTIHKKKKSLHKFKNTESSTKKTKKNIKDKTPQHTRRNR